MSYEDLVAEWEVKLRTAPCRAPGCERMVSPSPHNRARKTCSAKCRKSVQRIYDYWPDTADEYLGEDYGQLAPLSVGRTCPRIGRVLGAFV